jgi:hypothetical protein
VRYERRYPPTINHPRETAIAAEAMAKVVGSENLLTELQPTMGSEDFAFMLQARPGCYVWIGNGLGEGGCMLHNPRYDFNDEILPIGASYRATLVDSPGAELNQIWRPRRSGGTLPSRPDVEEAAAPSPGRQVSAAAQPAASACRCPPRRRCGRASPPSPRPVRPRTPP